MTHDVVLSCTLLSHAVLCAAVQWCIKAKVTRKGLMRSFSARGGGGGETKVFDVDLADAMVRGLGLPACIDRSWAAHSDASLLDRCSRQGCAVGCCLKVLVLFVGAVAMPGAQHTHPFTHLCFLARWFFLLKHMLAFFLLQGTHIQGSFWRESADKFYDSLQEDKVRVVVCSTSRALPHAQPGHQPNKQPVLVRAACKCWQRVDRQGNIHTFCP
jgi:hypothetical protein